jgi:hypothetical protein
MFQASANRLRTWLRWAEDVLADPLEDARATENHFRSHPHRRPLQWDRLRRPGVVPARPAHCISPIRSGGPVETRHTANR